MPAYVLVDVGPVKPEDRQAWKTYLEMAPSSIETYGGKYLVRGGSVQTVEGDWRPDGIVIVEFPDRASVERWYSSPEYAPALEVRANSGLTRDMLFIDGAADASSQGLSALGS